MSYEGRRSSPLGAGLYEYPAFGQNPGTGCPDRCALIPWSAMLVTEAVHYEASNRPLWSHNTYLKI